MKSVGTRVASALWAGLIWALVGATAIASAPNGRQERIVCGCQPERRLHLSIPPQTGPDVAGLQRYFAGLGLYGYPVDGEYGPATAQAVREFQVWSGLAATGVMDQMTWRAVGRIRATSVAQMPRLPGKARIMVDTTRNRLILYSDYTPVKEYIVATGKFDTPTPLGDWRITWKDSFGGAFGTRWLGLSVPWGVYGIHGTNVPWDIGGDVSAGCIRMFNQDVEELYELVDEGTPVKIIGHPLSLALDRPRLMLGDRWPAVVYVQLALRKWHFYKGEIDGVYGHATVDAVRRFQKSRRLKPSGECDLPTYDALGVIRFE